MIIRLLRQDPAWGSLLFGLPISYLYGMVLRSAIADGEGRGLFVFLVLVYFMVAAWVVIASNISSRCSRLALTLPIATQKLWLLRIVSLLGVSGLSWLAFSSSVLWNVAPLSADLDPPFMRLLLWKVGMAQVLLPFLLQTPKLELFKIPADAWYYAYVAIVIFLLILFISLVPMTAIAASAAIVIAVILGAFIYIKLPRSLSIAPAKFDDSVEKAIEPKIPVDLEATRGESIPQKISLNWTSFRILFHHWIGWLGFLSMVLFAMTLVFSYFDSRSLTTQGSVLALWIWALLSNGIARMYKIDPWPISRRRLLVWTLLPGLVAILLGIGFATGIRKINPRDFAMVEYRGHELKVPSEFQEVDWQGQVPLQTAPWGESHQPQAMKLWPGGDAAVFNPYEVSTEQSLKFRAWQTARAVARVHDGNPNATAEILLDDEYREALEKGSMKVEASIGQGSSLRSRTLAMSITFGMATLTLILIFGMSIYRGFTAQKNWFIPAFIAVVGGSLLALFTADHFGILSVRAVDSLPIILTRQWVESSSAPTWLLWTLPGITALIAYRLLEDQFRRIEVSFAHKPKPAIQEW